MKASQYNDTFAQLRNYADANKSDPFAYSRAMTHTLNGLCDNLSSAEDCRYKAEPVLETRIFPVASPLYPNGQTYTVTVYRNIQRP